MARVALINKISLGHAPNGCLANANQSNGGLGLSVEPNLSGLAGSPTEKRLVAANNYNDSIIGIDTATEPCGMRARFAAYASGSRERHQGGTFRTPWF